MTRAKVCGLTSEEDLRVAVDAGADAVGLISGVSVCTPREIPVSQAVSMAKSVPPFVTSVLVTMPDTPRAAGDLAAAVQPDAVQLHGADPADVGSISDMGIPVVAAVSVDEPDIDAYAETADALLVDSTDESGAGGTGRTHDWDRSADLVADLDVPVILAGGLTPENVRRAVRTARPFAVDVASGVEATGGVKDHDAVRRFVRNAVEVPVDA